MPRNAYIDTSQVTAGLRALAEKTPIILDPLMRSLAMAVRHRARKLAPVESGHLRQGIRYEKLSYGKYVVYAFTKWGGVRREYAVTVHEALQYRHKPGTGAKFIEIPIEAIAQSEAGKLIADELLKRMASGSKFTGAYRVYEGAIDQDAIAEKVAQFSKQGTTRRRKRRSRYQNAR